MATCPDCRKYLEPGQLGTCPTCGRGIKGFGLPARKKSSQPLPTPRSQAKGHPSGYRSSGGSTGFLLISMTLAILYQGIETLLVVAVRYRADGGPVMDPVGEIAYPLVNPTGLIFLFIASLLGALWIYRRVSNALRIGIRSRLLTPSLLTLGALPPFSLVLPLAHLRLLWEKAPDGVARGALRLLGGWWLLVLLVWVSAMDGIIWPCQAPSTPTGAWVWFLVDNVLSITAAITTIMVVTRTENMLDRLFRVYRGDGWEDTFA